MSGLSDRKIEIVRMLMASSPDSVVGGLHSALAGANDAALSEVRNLVSHEMMDRRFRDTVFSPVLRMFDDPARVKDRLVFPRSALPLIWKALKEEAPDQVSMVERLLEGATAETRTGPLNGLLRRVLEGLRDGSSNAYVAAAGSLNEVNPKLGETFCRCLALAPLVRDATYRLADWVARPNEERAAALRVTYRDATAISDDNGPLLFEMLASSLEEPWMIIRLISLVMDRPSQRYLGDSELSSFPTRVMDLIDVNLAQIGRFDHSKTPEEARNAAGLVKLAARQISELEAGIEFTRDSGWGARVRKQKQTLAAAVETRMRKTEALIGAALPYHTVRGAHASRKVPRMTVPAKAEDINNARTLLTFMEAIRASANLGGFAAARTKICESAAEVLDRYAEDGLALMRDHEVEDFDLAVTHLTYAAEFLELVRDSVSADLVRRRIVAATDNERRDHAKYG
jgi:hypothetical protein